MVNYGQLWPEPQFLKTKKLQFETPWSGSSDQFRNVEREPGVAGLVSYSTQDDNQRIERNERHFSYEIGERKETVLCPLFPSVI